MTDVTLTPGPGESQTHFRIRVLEHRVNRMDEALTGILRLRRDLAVGVLVLLVAQAVSSPQVWAIVLGALYHVAGIVRAGQ